MVHNRGRFKINWKGKGGTTYVHKKLTTPTKILNNAPIMFRINERVGISLWGRFEFLVATDKSCWQSHLPCLEGAPALILDPPPYYSLYTWAVKKWGGGGHMALVSPCWTRHCKSWLHFYSNSGLSLDLVIIMKGAMGNVSWHTRSSTFCWGSSPMLTLIVALPPYISTLQKYKQW